MYRNITSALMFLILLISNICCDNCKISWIQVGHKVPQSPYIIQVSISNTTGDLHTYFPNTNYDIVIKSKLQNYTFTQFYFKMRNKKKYTSPGTLMLREKELSMFHNSPQCINRIIDGPVSLAKLSLIIGWQSPAINSGCIEFRVVIKETELRYYVANKTICEDPRVIFDDPGETSKNCCACDEGKYELAFEGLWSRYTHAKFFPQKEWLAVFPTVIGVSHTPNYQFWRPYTKASNGLTKYAEIGDTAELELELKLNRRNIYTLIKFRGSNFQNKTKKSFTNLRVNSKNHVVSVIAKIDPSPDWFVGISSLELCQADCTWIESKILNLYGYDVGSRNGMLYEDFDERTDPQDLIQSLNTTWPPPENNKQSPFYDETNNTHNVRPLARIHLIRLRGSEKSCQHFEIAEDCVSSWSDWAECSAVCGTGVSKRTRSIIEPFNVDDCSLTLEESKPCENTHSRSSSSSSSSNSNNSNNNNNNNNNNDNNDNNDNNNNDNNDKDNNNNKCEKNVSEEDCSLTDWSEWTKCVQICGQESKKRTRFFKWHEHRQLCTEQFEDIVLEEKKECGNPPCPNDRFECLDERYNNWMEWFPCTSIKGQGIKFRYRTMKEQLRTVDLNGSKDYGYSACLYDESTCEISDISLINDSIKNIKELSELNEQTETVKIIERPDYCSLPADEGECSNGNNDNSHKYYYDQYKGTCLLFRYSGCGGNKNKFNDEKACKQNCIIHGRKIDCEMSKWSTWSACKSCNGFRSREKSILVYPENGGRMCPLTKVHRESCSKTKLCQVQQ